MHVKQYFYAELVLISVTLCRFLSVDSTCTDDDSIKKALKERNLLHSPPENENLTVILVSLRLQRMNFVPETNLLHVDAYLSRTWTDPRLSYIDLNPCHSPVSDTDTAYWVPPLQCTNGDSFRWADTAYSSLLYKNGTVLHIQRFEVSVPCLTDALTYPFGNTTCTIIWQNENYYKGHIVMQWDHTVRITVPKTDASPNSRVQVSDLELLHVNFDENNSVMSSSRYNELSADFSFSRYSNKIILLFYFPSLLILLMSWLSLVLGPMAITRTIITVGSLILLFLHYSSNMADLPRTSGITAIDVWKVATMIFVLANLFELMLVTCLASAGRSRRLFRCCRRPRQRNKGFSYYTEPLYEELNDLRQRRTRMTCSCCRYTALFMDFMSLNLFGFIFLVFLYCYITMRSNIVAYLNDFDVNYTAR